jgi:TetR/AcrR family transcriptional regulator, transcriptional repressor for nem operon
MGRTSTARERLLDATCRLIRTRSFGSVGVAEICAEAGVRKGSFYYFFESKQALTLEAVNAHWAGQRSIWVATLTGARPPMQRIRRLLELTAAGHRDVRKSDGVVHGCALANLALELSNQDLVVQSRLREIFDDQVELIHGALQEAAGDGSIGPAGSSRATARAIVAQIEGMVLFAKLGNNPDVLADLWGQTQMLVGVGA